MEEDPQQSAEPAKPDTAHALGTSNGRRVLQPSESFVQEMRTQAARAPAVPPVAAAVTPPTPPGTPQPSVQPHPPLQPIYPEVRRGAGAPPSPATAPVSATNGPDMYQSNETAVALILGLGGLIVIGSALSLWTYIQLASNGYTNARGITEDICALVLGVGIIKRKEIARVIYLLLAVVMIVFTSISLYRLMHTVNLIEAVTIQEYTQDARANQAKTANLPGTSAASRQQIAAQTQQKIDTFTKNQSAHHVDYSNYILLYSIELAPPVFMILPVVRREFS